MRILIFHGYLLHGTGSNVYNANLAAALARAGHEVHLLCQERDPLSLPWVDAAGNWDGGRLELTVRPGAPKATPARATVYRPRLAGLLPVYVADRYEGVEARPFQDCSEEEVDEYIACNVAAVAEVVARCRPDVALANHVVMGPAILSRALRGRVPYAVKVHGSALEYTVKPHPRFLPFAQEGLGAARAVLTGSRHTAESLWAHVDVPGLRDRTRLGPPGVDVDRFAPRSRQAAARGLAGLRRRLEAPARPGAVDDGSSFARAHGEAAAALGDVDLERDRLVVYVGKLIGSKGVELLLAAWPLVLAAEPAARLLIVGFGAFREGLERLAGALAAGDLGAARDLRAEDGRELPELGAFLARVDGAYLRSARALPERIGFAGRLDHGELVDLLPAADALVAPSTFPEAFGMVAAEGAACGALPVVARHSGLAEVAERLALAVPGPARAWLSFEVGDAAVPGLASCLTGWLGAGEEVREATREAVAGVARDRWSWDGVARTVLAAAQGRLDLLGEP